MANDFVQLVVSKPAQFRDGLIIGNPDATAIFEDAAIPYEFDDAQPSLTMDGRSREPRLIVVMSSIPFQLAMLAPNETLETVTLNDTRAPFEFMHARDGMNPLSTYNGLVPGGVSKIYIRAFEEIELDSNS